MRIGRYWLWNRIYGWYFRNFKFNPNCEIGHNTRIRITDEKYETLNDDDIRKGFDFTIKSFIPEKYRDKVEYIKYRDKWRTTVGWIYRGSERRLG